MLRFELTDDVSARLESLAKEGLELARRQMVEDASRLALGRIIEGNPVDTARSRAAWVAALADLGGTPPADWQGPHPTGAGQGAAEGTGTLTDEADRTDVRITNRVDYIGHLEYGTSRLAPFAMVRAALAQMRQAVAALFRLEGK